MSTYLVSWYCRTAHVSFVFDKCSFEIIRTRRAYCIILVSSKEELDVCRKEKCQQSLSLLSRIQCARSYSATVAICNQLLPIVYRYTNNYTYYISHLKHRLLIFQKQSTYCGAVNNSNLRTHTISC